VFGKFQSFLKKIFFIILIKFFTLCSSNVNSPVECVPIIFPLKIIDGRKTKVKIALLAFDWSWSGFISNSPSVALKNKKKSLFFVKIMVERILNKVFKIKHFCESFEWNLFKKIFIYLTFIYL